MTELFTQTQWAWIAIIECIVIVILAILLFKKPLSEAELQQIREEEQQENQLLQQDQERVNQQEELIRSLPTPVLLVSYKFDRSPYGAENISVKDGKGQYHVFFITKNDKLYKRDYKFFNGLVNAIVSLENRVIGAVLIP